MIIAAVIPVRNRPAVLVRAVRSILDQTLPVAEIIVVDDASDPGAMDAAYASPELTDPRVRVIARAARGGASAARNVGVRAAAADWIAFLDSDDRWYPEKLARQQEALAAHPDAVACFTGHRAVFSPDFGFDHHLPARVDPVELLGINILSTTSSAMVRRDALAMVGGFDETLRSCQDWDLWARLSEVGRLITVPEPQIAFHQDGTDRITKDFEAVMTGHRVVFDRMLARARRRTDRRRVRSLHALRSGQIMHGDFARPLAARLHFLRSVLLWPSRAGVRALIRR